MKPEIRKFAPYGIYLAGIALLVTLGLYIVFRQFTLPVQISLGVTVIGLAVAVLLDPEKARQLFTGRQARYGSNALLVSIAFLGILVVINFVAFKNPKSWDLTQDKTNTLAPETIATLQKLQQPVTVEAFFTARNALPQDDTRKLLNNLAAKSNGKLTYKFIDPDADPMAAQAAKITVDGTLVLTMGSHQEQVTTQSESDITNALIRLINPGERTIYFLTGHGERSLSATDDMSYSSVNDLLKTKNYTVKPLELLSTPKVPDDAKAVIIAGPTKPLADSEITALDAYLKKGGALVVFSEPPTAVPTSPSPADPLVAYLTKSWGITLQNDFIIDPNVNPPVVAVSDTSAYGGHAIVLKMNGLATVFPTARSVDVNAPSPQIVDAFLVKTSPSAWGETDISSIQSNQVNFDKAKDHAGPVGLAAAGTDSTTKGRVVVVGDADFASNAFYARYGNSTLFTNMIDWAASQENLLNLTPKNTTSRVLITPQNYQVGLLALLLIIGLPGIVIILGISTWVQRRRRV